MLIPYIINCNCNYILAKMMFFQLFFLMAVVDCRRDPSLDYFFGKVDNNGEIENVYQNSTDYIVDKVENAFQNPSNNGQSKYK